MPKQMEDYQIRLQKIEFIAPKINQGLEFILVLSGELIVETNSRFYRLKEKDLLVLNRNEFYQMQGTDNSVLLLNITDTFIERYYPEFRNSRFECYSREIDMGRESMISTIQRLLAEIMITFYRKDGSHRLEIQRNVCEILLILIRRFEQEASVFEKFDSEDLRLTQLINYMEKNYQQIITLEDMAQKMYLSTGYLSRYFKQKMGMGFSRYLMNIRLKHSVKDLLYTRDSISQISMNNGFANTKSFTSLFKEVYGVTPSIYREQNVEQQLNSVESHILQDDTTILNTPDVLMNLGTLLIDHDESYSNTETRFEELTIDVSTSSAANVKRTNHVVIIRELTELLKENIQAQVLIVKNEIRLNYIGIRHLLSGTTISPEVETDEEIATTSPYFNSDVALNFMKKNNLSLFVRIDYKEISIDEDTYFKKLHNFLKHCLQVYGDSYLNTWNFMFYESYYTAVGVKELHRVYLKMYNLLKTLVPGMQVGVFLPFSYNEERTNDHHAWILKEDKRIDFIGYHSNQNEVIDYTDLEDDRFYLSKDYLPDITNKIKAYLKKYQIEKPLHLISWNTLSGNTRFTNGTFFRGALVLKGVLDIAGEVESIGFWINTELHEKVGKDQKIRLEGMELFHYFSGKRPPFFAMLFAEKLRGDVIAKGSDYIMTKNDRGYQLVLMNCNNVNPYFSKEEGFLQKLNKDIHVHISGLQSGEYQIRKHTFDKTHGALYTMWCNLNSRHGMDEEIIDYINRSSHPSLEIFDETIEEDWSFYSYLTVNAIHFYDLRRSAF